jgi:peptide/nickel transport system substrate-binding protein
LFPALLFTACGGGGEDAAERARTLVVGLSGNPRSLDPRMSTDVASARVQQLLFDSLVALDESSNLVPELAESWEMPDEQTYVFHLRRDVRFHHGRPLTAEDVVYTFESIRDPALRSPRRAAYAMIESIESPDPYTVCIRTQEPFAPFLINMVQGIVPRDLAEAGPEAFAAAPSGTGAFRFESFRPDIDLVLRRYDECYRGAPAVEKIVIRIIPEANIRLLELESGALDFLQNEIPPDALPRLRARDDVEVLTWPGTNFAYLGFNLPDPILSDLAVRRAIAHGLDRESYIRDILGGLARPASSLLPPGHWAYASDVRTYEHDPEKARRILDEAGYAPDDEGVRVRLTFKTSTNERTRRLAEAMQQDLAEVGIALTIRSFDWATFYNDILKGNFQLYSLSWVGITDPDILHSIFHSASVPPNGRNRGHYANPRVDELLDRARRTFDRGKAAELYREVQRILAEDLPYVNLWYEDNVAVLSRRFTGFLPYPAGNFDALIRLRPTE